MQDIHTDRLVLSPLSADHAEAFHAMSIDPDVRRYLWEGQIISMQQVQQMVVDSEACFAKTGSGLFAMTIDLPADPNDGAFVGFCGHRLFDQGEDIELLFGMQPKFWGRGFGGEGARAVLRHGFVDCGMEAVVAATETPNQRSVRVLQRLGMSFARRGQRHGLDTVFYDMRAAEYKAL